VASRRARDGQLICATGASRSGKTEYVRRRVASASRLLVWDWPKGEWGMRFNCTPVSRFETLRQLVKPGAPAARLAFCRVTKDPWGDFDAWSELAWIFIRAHPGSPVVAEELARVTSPGKAPPAWGNICSMGLGYGADIYAITQRPAESDKTSLGNASILHAGLQTFPRDRRSIAEYLDVPQAEVDRLRQLDYIERDYRTGRLSRGKLSFGRK
jgi:hypothetical protein